MTIAMEDESSFTLASATSMSTLSPHSNLSIQMLSPGNLRAGEQGMSIQTNQSSLTCNGGSQAQAQAQAQSNGAFESGSPNGSMSDNCPFAIFLIRSNNGLDLFEERRISLDKPCKIGRSVAKIRPEANNAIFDCKVLSRNHALLWHENSKFFIQDTKSSNGTFLNGNRLGKSNEDSDPYELTSGDIVQFGVDVTENTKKVTHGCITVEIKLYHRQGVEASNKANPQANKIDVQTQELYQLALFLQEAMVREEMLHQKINSLQAFIDEAKETSENGWLTLISEDRLLSRIDFLEKQTILHTKTFNDENMTKMINTLRDEKFGIENEAKATIQKMIEEKNQISQKYDELKSKFSIQEEECNQLQRINDETKKSLVDLASKYQDVLTEVDDLKANMAEMKSKYQEQLNESENEKLTYESKLASLHEAEMNLKAQIESLMAEKDFQKKDFERIINKYEQNNKANAVASPSIETASSPVVDGEVSEQTAQSPVTNNHATEGEQEEQEASREVDNEDEDAKAAEVDPYEDVFYSNNHESCESKNVLIEVTDALLNAKEKLAAKQHKLLSDASPVIAIAANLNNNSNKERDENDENSYSNGPIANHGSKTVELNGLIENAESKLNHHKSAKTTSTAKLSATTVTQTEALADLDKLSAELESVRAQLALESTRNGRLVEENKQLKSLAEAQEPKPAPDQPQLDASLQVTKLQEELKENSAKLKSVESELADKVELIKKLLAIENKMAASGMDNQEYLVLKDECIEMKNRLQVIESKMMKYLDSSNIKTPNTEEYSAALMSEECKLFEQSYQQLQQLKENIQDKESKIQLNLTDAQKEADQNQQKLLIVQEQLQKLEETCENYKNRLLVAERTVKELNGEYDHLSLRTKIVSYFSTVPLFILILAVMVAFYPILATITATGL